MRSFSKFVHSLLVSALIISTISIRRISGIVLILIWLAKIHRVLRRVHRIVVHWVEHRISILTLLVRHCISVGVVLILIVMWTILIALVLVAIHRIISLLLVIASILVSDWVIVSSHRIHSWIHWISSCIIIETLLIILRTGIFHISIRCGLNWFWDKTPFIFIACINRWNLEFLFLFK